MNRQANSLSGRVGKLERLQRPEVSSFYLVLGRDEADIANKVRKAKERGEINRGDKFDTRIWPHPTPPPEPRWTKLHETTAEELETIIGGKERNPKAVESGQTGFERFSDADLSNLYAAQLRTVN